MTRFADYATKYQTIRMERRDGILQMTFHTDGGPLQWGLLPHGEFPQAFRDDVGADPENKVVILTGTGDLFSGPQAAGVTGMRSTPAQWDRVYWSWGWSASCSGVPRCCRAPGRWPSRSRGSTRSSSATRACCSPSRSRSSSWTTWATASRWKA